MNILFFKSTTISPMKGGVDRVTDVLYHELKKTHNVYALMLKKTCDIKDSDFFYIPDERNVLSEDNLSFAENLIKKLKIDVIINQDGITPCSSMFILKINRGCVKLITVLHSNLKSIYGATVRLPCPLIPVIPQRWLRVCDCLCNIIFRKKYNGYWNAFEERNDVICLLDESLRESTAEFIGMPMKSEKFYAVNNPITLKNDGGVDLNLKKKQVVFVGRLSAEKNLSMLLRAWEKKNACCADWNLVIVGDGPEYERLTRLSKIKHLKNVEFVGRQDPKKYYSDSSIFCMTSIYEGMPLVLIEAMSFGCVPMAFDSFATAKSLIDDEKNGYLVKPFKIDDYASKLSSLMRNPTKLRNMSTQALRKSQNYSVNNIISQWEHLFEKLVR